MNGNPEFASFARLIESLRPWLDQVVIVGGWAHRLYRLHAFAQPLRYEPLATLDGDIALPTRFQSPATRFISGLPRMGYSCPGFDEPHKTVAVVKHGNKSHLERQGAVSGRCSPSSLYVSPDYKRGSRGIARPSNHSTEVCRILDCYPFVSYRGTLSNHHSGASVGNTFRQVQA